MASGPGIDVVLEPWVVLDGNRPDVRAGRRLRHALALVPTATLRPARDVPLSVEPRGDLAEHLVVADVTGTLEQHGHVYAVLVSHGLSGLVEVAPSAPGAEHLWVGGRVQGRFRFEVDAYAVAETLRDEPGFRDLTRDCHVSRILLVDGDTQREVRRTNVRLDPDDCHYVLTLTEEA